MGVFSERIAALLIFHVASVSPDKTASKMPLWCKMYLFMQMLVLRPHRSVGTDEKNLLKIEVFLYSMEATEINIYLNKDRPTDVTCFIFCSTCFEC